jgi:integrase/recombinase XerD
MSFDNHLIWRDSMSQAKVLTEKEMRKVLLYCASHKHAQRNKAMLLMTHLAGMRVGEVAALRLRDVLDSDGSVRSEIKLAADQTKGSRGRTVLIPKRLQEMLRDYLASRFTASELVAVASTEKIDHALFPSQKHPKRGFTANTLAQHFHHLYKAAGIEGASSHSGRRSFITGLADKGVGVRVLMELAGHRSPAVTMRYIDASPAVMRAAVELV